MKNWIDEILDEVKENEEIGQIENGLDDWMLYDEVQRYNKTEENYWD